ncbi:hypothetical protein AB0O75_11155 [Streptomyces sp. NPDC088921]|uniref:hypothetical protein n=1 Tax=unclassified Streptomyces TaxID=2593676 RepID=UPI003426D12C
MTETVSPTSWLGRGLRAVNPDLVPGTVQDEAAQLQDDRWRFEARRLNAPTWPTSSAKSKGLAR